MKTAALIFTVLLSIAVSGAGPPGSAVGEAGSGAKAESNEAKAQRLRPADGKRPLMQYVNECGS